MSYIDQPEAISHISNKVLAILIVALQHENLRVRLDDGTELKGFYRGVTWTKNGRAHGHGCVIHFEPLDDDWMFSCEVNRITDVEGI